MIDKTTEGYTAADAEIEGMLRNLCAYALSDPEPLQRYLDLTHQQVVFDGVIVAIRRERGKALADLLASGLPADKVAELARLSVPSQVKTLVTGAGLAMPRPPRKQSAGKAATRASARGGTSSTSTPTRSSTEVREGVPMLPVSAVPAGKRLLTPDELRALGLSAPSAATGGVAAARAGAVAPTAIKAGDRRAATGPSTGRPTVTGQTSSRVPIAGQGGGRPAATGQTGRVPAAAQSGGRPPSASQPGGRPASTKQAGGRVPTATPNADRPQTSPPTDVRRSAVKQAGVSAAGKPAKQPKGGSQVVMQPPTTVPAPPAASESEPKRRRRGLLARR